MTRKPPDHLHGRFHGSIERRLPGKHIIVPAEQLMPPPLPKVDSHLGYLTSSQIMEEWGMNRHLLTRWVNEGDLQPVATWGRRNLFTHADVEAIIEKWTAP